MKGFCPRRPVKSFQDLEIYQKSLGVCAAVGKRVPENANPIAQKLRESVLKIPEKIATAHSLRFANQDQATRTLEEAMLLCNLSVVYLEQYRDIYNENIETEFFDEQIKTLLSVRMKTLHLQMSWKKFKPYEK